MAFARPRRKEVEFELRAVDVCCALLQFGPQAYKAMVSDTRFRVPDKHISLHLSRS